MEIETTNTAPNLPAVKWDVLISCAFAGVIFSDSEDDLAVFVTTEDGTSGHWVVFSDGSVYVFDTDDTHPTPESLCNWYIGTYKPVPIPDGSKVTLTQDLGMFS